MVEPGTLSEVRRCCPAAAFTRPCRPPTSTVCERWYEDVLGFTPMAIRPNAVLYETTPGSVFAISRGSVLSSGTHTQMAFTVDDVDAEVADLKARGVVFEEYEAPTDRRWDRHDRAGPGGVVQGSGREPAGGPAVRRPGLTGAVRERSAVATAQERHAERPQLAAGEAAGDDGVLVHDPARRAARRAPRRSRCPC